MHIVPNGRIFATIDNHLFLLYELGILARLRLNTHKTKKLVLINDSRNTTSFDS